MKKTRNETRHECSDASELNGRRSFIKKLAYSAPGLIVMGTMVKPKRAEAGFGGPPSDADFSQPYPAG